MTTSERKQKDHSATILTQERVKGAGSANAEHVRQLSKAEKLAGLRFLGGNSPTKPKSPLHQRMQSSRG